MKKLLLLLIMCSNLVSIAQPRPNPNIQRPKLVVGIVVDQMRMDYIYKYWSRYSSTGFMKLMSEGHLCSNAHFNQVPTYTAPGHACIYTGTTGANNGIVGNDWFNPNNALGAYCVGDPDAITVGGVATAGKVSPKNCVSSTLGDELKYASGFRSKSVGVSLKDRGAVFGGGHAADGAYWYDSRTGNFVTSSYYMKNLPDWVRSFNDEKRSDKIIKGKWETYYDISSYDASTEDNTSYEGLVDGESSPVFPHVLNSITTYDQVKYSPFGNTLLKDFALHALRSLELGKDEHTDLLAISFSATDYVGHRYGTNSIETEDIYIRLDRDVADLLQMIEQEVGSENVLVFFTSDHGALPNPNYLKDRKIPAEFFQKKLMVDSLKAHLKKRFGSDKLIAGIVKSNIYLNEVEVAKLGPMSKNGVEDIVVRFLEAYPGIRYAFPSHELRKMSYTSKIGQLVQNAYYPKRSGNVIFLYDPNVISWYTTTGTQHGSGYNDDTHVPLIFYGYGVQPGETKSRVVIEDIAATVSQICRISRPNACTGEPIVSVIE